MTERNHNTEPLVRSWLKIRIVAFLPRIQKIRYTKAAPYTFTLEEIAADMRRTLVELDDRIAKSRRA